jgi:pimeloyl-ACP methyl ester carboxylesterase
VNYLEFGRGNGQTIVFLHGGNVAGWMWGEQVPAFDDYHVLVPDLPGFGASNTLPWHSIAATADRVADLLEDRAQGPAHVVGLSLGSSVAIELAARHPLLVQTLFLASAQVAPPRSIDVLVGRAMMLFWKRRGFWTSLARSYGLSGDDAELFVTTGLGIRVETARAVLDEVRLGMPATLLSRVSVPTLAVAGAKDSGAVSAASLERIRAGIAGSLAAVAPGMHHQWNIENVQLFNAALREWLDHGAIARGLEAQRPE